MREWTGISFLIVEDDVGMREILCDLVAGNGAKVFNASNGSEALRLFETERIDFVLTDVQMPVMGGVELVNAIRSRNLAVPVLFITGHSNLINESAIDSGAAGLIHKPYSFKTLLIKINQLLPPR